ncbi:hypothetical protein [Nonomuraea diastatica]|uniref:Uncharacterized protein n=1 Tax=Nonomuraea diastatica TaxID=1848329 RepID=A0A4V2YFU8_9ACTN|nr:hypothetical protein [Nonomuraea diastatica]TDD24487.1 hypothetical protein E1294_05890 [Nonomuraea diastatica]
MLRRVVGAEVEIAQLEHSPLLTRSYASWLLGRSGVVVAEIRDRSVAVVQLAEDGFEFPAGARRRSLAWADLNVRRVPTESPSPLRPYRAGTSGSGSSLVQHAVEADDDVALCAELVRPVIVGDWHVPFVATLACACSECRRLAATAEPSGSLEVESP